MAAIECPNREVNLQMCACTNEDCERRGICCLCIQNHVGKGGKSSCMRGAERPAATLALRGVDAKCDRQDGNAAWCACTYEECGNRGKCCDCVRNHWANASYPSPACMKA